MSMTETLDDILAEICTVYDVTGKDLADRIRAAVKRERDGNVQSDVQKIGHNLDNSTIGNVLEMRKVLGQISTMEVPHNFQAERRDIADACYDLTRAIRQAKKALSAPPRNCDVGTAEEQVERHREWCGHDIDYSHCCNDCRNCFARWAQMPYEEGGVK